MTTSEPLTSVSDLPNPHSSNVNTRPGIQSSHSSTNTILNNSCSLLHQHDNWVQMDGLSKSLYNNDDLPLNDTIKHLKTKSILKTIEKYKVEKDINILKELSRSTDGLINNETRRIIWPILLNINSENHSLTNDNQCNLLNDNFDLLQDLNDIDLPPHKDEDQVKLDVQRSFTLFNHIQNSKSSSSYSTILSSSDVKNIKNKLSNLIIKILRKYPCLNYYQGYHDVSSIILLVCYNSESNEFDEKLAYNILEKMTLFHLRDFMLHDITLSIDHLRLIPTLLENLDGELFNLIKCNSNSTIRSNGLLYDYKFFQGISSIITLYSHDLTNLSQILIIWDFIISYNSVLVSVYFYVSSLIELKEQIWETLNIEDDEISHVDSALLHTTLSPTNLFENLSDSTLIKILQRTKNLIEKYPIENLPNNQSTWAKWFLEYNDKSVLINTSNINKQEDLNIYSVEILSTIIQDQDNQVSRQVIEELQYEQEIYSQVEQEEEELNNSISSLNEDESNTNSLSSSLTLHTSLTSSSIHKLTSTTIFKKLFTSDERNENNHMVVRNSNWFISKNFYKLSLTIGLIGFLLHFLIKDELVYKSAIFKEICRNTNTITSNVIKFFKFNDLNSNFMINDIGLGNIRSTIYNFNN